MLSPVFASAGVLARELPGLRREVRDLARSRGVEIVGAGAHPFSEPTEQPLTGGAHNLRVEREMGWPVDLEYAWRDGSLYVLQCRPITTLA